MGILQNSLKYGSLITPKPILFKTLAIRTYLNIHAIMKDTVHFLARYVMRRNFFFKQLF